MTLIYCGPENETPVPCPDTPGCGFGGPLERAGVELDGSCVIAYCPRCDLYSRVVG